MYLFNHVHIFFIRVSLTVGNLVSKKCTQIYVLAIYITSCSGYISSSLASSPFFYFAFSSHVIPSSYTKNTKICLLKQKCINSWLQ